MATKRTTKKKSKAAEPEVAVDGETEAPARKTRGGALVVVESPAKAKTIKKYLGSGYTVKASVGHVVDLPKSKMGVDIENGFIPEYVAIRGKAKVISEIRSSAKDAEVVYLAPDPDREGEAIAWHLAGEIRKSNRNIKRILFNEITERGIKEALKHPTEINSNKFESQQARRILDRLVGYEISPMLWNKVRRGLSAGRVQSVAVRLVVEREREIAAFKPVEYWSVECDVEAKNPPPFKVRLHTIAGKKAEMGETGAAHEAVRGIQAADQSTGLMVDGVEKKERRKYAPPPFITSRLQQEAARKLRFTAKKTMAVAQRLYEGIELGKEGAVGLITYMRTDSVRLSPDAVHEARQYIDKEYGREFLPEAPVFFKTKKSAQDAHEAIRPTSMRYEPAFVHKVLMVAAGGDAQKRRDAEDSVRLYQLIWNRFVACQMKPAVYDQTTVDVSAGIYGLRATGQVLKFAGFTTLYDESTDDGKPGEESSLTLPVVEVGERLKLHQVTPEQHFTQPPPRFGEASLVKELEEQGIGRPSTYAAIMSTIQDRGYVEKREARFYPTLLGSKVNDLLVESFPDIVNVKFTAQMEDGLDQVEEGTANWQRLLGDFYTPFKVDLEKAAVNMRDLKREETPTEIVCQKCSSPMVIKWGRNGEFLACSNYPNCKSTSEFKRNEDGSVERVEQPATNEVCETCGAPMVRKRGRFGEFLACSRYPDCKTTKAISLGVNCPKPDCGGFLVEKRSKRGKTFFGCSNYGKKKCDFVSWDRPIPTVCPQCAAPFLVKKETQKMVRVRCLTEGCGYVEDQSDRATDAA